MLSYAELLVDPVAEKIQPFFPEPHTEINSEKKKKKTRTRMILDDKKKIIKL